MRLGLSLSGLSWAIERMPDKEQKIVFVLLREFERNKTATLAAIKERAESDQRRTGSDAHRQTLEGGLRETVEFVCEAEKLGLDVCWVAEAWGADAVPVPGHLAARTDRLMLGSGVLQVGTRTPVAIAQAALTIADLRGGRFLLGLASCGI